MKTNKAENKAVRLKGIGGKLLIKVNPDESPDHLKKEIETVFNSLKPKIQHTDVVLDIGMVDDEKNLFHTISSFLKKKYSVTHVNRFQNRNKKKPLPSSEFYEPTDFSSDAMMVTGRIRSGQKLHAKRHLIIMGDVNPGGEVIAGGDIVVLGKLYGAARAGQKNEERSVYDEEAVIIALDFKPTRIQIASLVVTELKNIDKTVGWARISEKGIEISDYVSDAPFSKNPKLELR